MYTRHKDDLLIASVTVVFKGASVLRAHLDSLKQQTRAIDEIVVVNNASPDETLSLVSTEYPDVSIINLPSNAGVGGGFSAGIKYLLDKKKYDWIWLFDHDSIPVNSALSSLLEALNDLDPREVGILAPQCVHPTTGMVWSGLSWRSGRMLPTPIDPQSPVTFVDSVISSGTLLRRTAVETIGPPRSDYFMDFVDHEYCLRMRRYGLKIALIPGSVVHHSLGDPLTFKILGWTKYWADHEPWREYYMARNEFFTIWREYPQASVKIFTLWRLARHILGIVLFGKQKRGCIAMICRGVADGLRGRLGKRVLPQGEGSVALSGVFHTASQSE